MRKRDVDPATFGAEALPGGLVEINHALGAQPRASSRGGTPSPAKTPLVGLIAIAAYWTRKFGARR